MTRTWSVVLFGGLFVALAGAGCGVLDDLGNSNSGVTAAPPLAAPAPAAPAPAAPAAPSPTPAPPTEPPVVVDPGPPLCGSSAECAGGFHCSVDDGECFSTCAPGEACPAICSYVCVVDKAPPPPPPGCMTDADCTTAPDYCDGGCSCVGTRVGTGAACAPGTETACFADPCVFVHAVCNANGSCGLANNQPPAPPPPSPPLPPSCDRHTMGGPTSCKDASTWQRYSDDDCRSRGGSLMEYTQREMCGGGGSVYVDYVCCSTS